MSTTNTMKKNQAKIGAPEAKQEKVKATNYVFYRIEPSNAVISVPTDATELATFMNTNLHKLSKYHIQSCMQLRDSIISNPKKFEKIKTRIIIDNTRVRRFIAVSYFRENNCVKYGAAVYKKSTDVDNFNKNDLRKTAIARYQKDPVVLNFKPKTLDNLEPKQICDLIRKAMFTNSVSSHGANKLSVKIAMNKQNNTNTQQIPTPISV